MQNASTNENEEIYEKQKIVFKSNNNKEEKESTNIKLENKSSIKKPTRLTKIQKVATQINIGNMRSKNYTFNKLNKI